MAKIENIRHLYSFVHGLGEFLVNQGDKYIHIGDTLNYIAVCKNGEWYYIDQLGKRVLL